MSELDWKSVWWILWLDLQDLQSCHLIKKKKKGEPNIIHKKKNELENSRRLYDCKIGSVNFKNAVHGQYSTISVHLAFYYLELLADVKHLFVCVF